MASSMMREGTRTQATDDYEDYERRWPKTRRRILRANRDLARRVQENGLTFSYTAETDVMQAYLSLPYPAHAEYLDDDNPFVTFFDDETYLIGAFEFVFLAERARKGDKIPELWLTAYRYFQEGRFKYEYPSFKYHALVEELESLGKATQALLPTTA